LKMKNVRFYFPNESKPIHKLVSPEPHFVEEERNLIENHFNYLGPSNKSDDIEEWKCFEMDCEGHLVSLKSSKFHLSNENIEHLSTFPHLRNLEIFSSITKNQSVTNLRILSNLVNLEITFCQEFQDSEFLKDLGLFTNLRYLFLCSYYGFLNCQFDSFPSLLYFVFLLDIIILPPSFSNLSNLAYICLTNFTFQGFKEFILVNHLLLICKNRRRISILFLPKYDKIDIFKPV